MGDFDLTGRVAIITGGNGGIGLGMADALAQAGCAVSIWGRNPEKNARASARLRAHGGAVDTRLCDVSDRKAIEASFVATLAKFGRIDACFARASAITRILGRSPTTRPRECSAATEWPPSCTAALEVLSPSVRLRSPSSNAKCSSHLGRFKLWSRGSPPSVAPALARSTHTRTPDRSFRGQRSRRRFRQRTTVAGSGAWSLCRRVSASRQRHAAGIG